MLNIIDNIKLLDFFKTLDLENLRKLSNLSTINIYPAGYTLYYEEDLKEKIFFLVDGLMKSYKVDRYDNEIFLNHVYPNSLISEISSLSEDEIYCSTNTEFLKESVVLEINYEIFKKNFIETNVLTTQFIDALLSKNRQLYCILDREVVFDATAKVAYSLHDDLYTFNKLKRQEMASMLHIQPATLSRILQKLVRQDIISVEATQIAIKRKDELKKIFNGCGL
jgi:CRP-like cAMP-binding protein